MSHYEYTFIYKNINNILNVIEKKISKIEFKWKKKMKVIWYHSENTIGYLILKSFSKLCFPVKTK